MDDQTLDTLCTSFDHAINLCTPDPEIDADRTLETPNEKSEELESSCDLLESSGASDDTHGTCSSKGETLPIFLKIKDLSSKVQIIRKEHERLCNEVKSMSDSLVGSEAFTALQNLSKEFELLKSKYHDECEFLKRKYLKECTERKKLYNEVIELKGNIRVFCRCRPLKQDEIAKGSSSVVDFESSQENELQIICSDSSKKQFKFDHVFRPEDDQDAVFVQTLPIVTSVLDGYNVCIFAYGQTGTGKTYTMEGTPEDRGVNYRTLEELFRISNERSSIIRYELFVSMLEVYNEKIRDLLVDSSNQPAKKLDIKQSAEGTQEVPGLVEAQVYGTDEVWGLLKSGSQVRSVGSTNANELSSRSHCLLRVTVVAENLINGQRTRSHLWLVDLAGSERVGRIEVEGDRLKESQFINKSLSALGDVISALASKTTHVPYRNSKLTHMLQSSLGGDCKTLMFVQISPNSADFGETLCSLNFASRVRGVEHGPARKQQDHAELFKYKQLVEKTKQDEKETKKLQDNVQSLQLRLAAREHLCRNLQEKVRDLESQLAEERKTRLKQETRALASLSSQPTQLATNHHTQKAASTDKKPPLAPPKLRLPLRRISNMMMPPSHSPLPSKNKTRASSFLPVVNEDKENLLRVNKSRQILKPRRGSIAVRPPPPSQIPAPKRRSSIATLRPEPSLHMPTATPVQRSKPDRVMGRQSFVWDPQRVWRTSRVSSPTTPMVGRASSSSKFRGSPPPSQGPGSWRPRHPTVIALQKKNLVWSPLKLKSMKYRRSSLMS
ncbi:P-loop containing nucleoside triphosphate hydrolases superfamily protein [Striga hermonthica]|uniref:Kinesin-like protein n=1 Tax=Striga hermonthica TaxID=68872 RepID=A0A9N7MXU3_STRHE|nr:P-loop containing nucleoside triphosphate hydrolases superfamily protein [Striga hermonthica]